MPSNYGIAPTRPTINDYFSKMDFLLQSRVSFQKVNGILKRLLY